MQMYRKSEHEQRVDFHIIKASEIILVDLMWSGSSVLFTMPFDCMDCSLVHTHSSFVSFRMSTFTLEPSLSHRLVLFGFTFYVKRKFVA